MPQMDTGCHKSAMIISLLTLEYKTRPGLDVVTTGCCKYFVCVYNKYGDAVVIEEAVVVRYSFLASS